MFKLFLIFQHLIVHRANSLYYFQFPWHHFCNPEVNWLPANLWSHFLRNVAYLSSIFSPSSDVPDWPTFSAFLLLLAVHSAFLMDVNIDKKIPLRKACECLSLETLECFNAIKNSQERFDNSLRLTEIADWRGKCVKRKLNYSRKSERLTTDYIRHFKYSTRIKYGITKSLRPLNSSVFKKVFTI